MTGKISNAAPSQAPEATIPNPRRGIHLVDDKKTGEKPEKARAGAVPPKKRLGLKIGAPLAGFFVAAGGAGIGLGESKNLPEPVQQRYDAVKAGLGGERNMTLTPRSFNTLFH